MLSGYSNQISPDELLRKWDVYDYNDALSFYSCSFTTTQAVFISE